MKAHSVVIVTVLCALVAMLLSAQVGADHKQLESALNAQFADKIVIVRGFYVGAHLRYETSGAVLGKQDTGPWTAYGMVQVKHVSVKTGKILLSAKRVLNVYDTDRCQFGNAITDISVDLEIQASTDSIDANQALAIIDKTVTTEVSVIKDAVPDYWKPWFAGRKLIGKNGQAYCGTAEQQQRSAQLVSSAASSPGSEPRPAYVKADGTPVFRVANGIRPPHGQSTPDPAYTAVARQAKFEGTTVLELVVNEKGEPTDLGIKRPLGAGLDDVAVERVKQWRFTPATYNGKPVAVEINVEVNFRLH